MISSWVWPLKISCGQARKRSPRSPFRTCFCPAFWTQRFSDLQSQSSPDPGRSRSPAASAEPQSVPSVELSSACHTMSAISRVSNPMNCVQVMRRPFGRPLSLRSPPHLMFLMTILISDETWCLTFLCQEVRGREGQGQGPSEGVQISEAVATASFPQIWAARCAQATKASLAKTICWTCSFCLHLRRQCGPKMLEVHILLIFSFEPRIPLLFFSMRLPATSLTSPARL